ncbi:hypothetical protein [Bosea sp. (in: a-proteobacteria)]|uniref:hypothetical protein n=1 Tax=Bosea sp. (in: a-proteobacteria) TaxID=1871050 RepID=UPI001AC1B0F7|nr:hypothetical protein [Bosea sp. (in: a-proteobacteria)]MBN9443652.1 hypothetical protein [Bosea sp. (in: a-proteobacteria)]
MSDAADAAMIAIDNVLRKPLIARLMNLCGIPPLKRVPIENRQAMRVIRRHMAGQPVEHEQLEVALHRVVLSVKPALMAEAWNDFLDDYEAPATLDEGEAEHARSLIMRGEIDDCLHHLERALPAEYAVIAERLAHHFRSRK